MEDWGLPGRPADIPRRLLNQPRTLFPPHLGSAVDEVRRRDSTLTGGAVTSTVGDVSFTNMPYIVDAGASCGVNFINSGSAGTLDGVSIVNGHEYAETITDQNPAGGWTNTSSGEEDGD